MTNKAMPAGRQGFTLIELLVVMFIIILLSSIILIDYRSGERRYAFEQSVQRLVSDFRRAQILAISGGGSGEVQYCGFGVVFRPSVDNSYIFYKDYDSSGCPSGDKAHDGNDIPETILLPDGVKIKELTIDTDTKPKLDVFFEPPDPDTYIDSNSNPGREATITLEASSISASKTIKVTTTGLIEVQ